MGTRPTLVSLNNYHYRRGGADVLFLEHNRSFAERGWRVVPFAMRHPRNLESEWDRYFVEEIELGSAYGPIERVRKALKAMYSLEARRKLAALLEETSPALCHAHNVYHHLSPAVLPVIKARGVPLVMTLHDLKLACPAYSMLSDGVICERCKGGRLYNVAVHRCMKGSAALSAWAMTESYLHTVLRSYTANVDVFVVPSLFFMNKFTEWGFDTRRFVHVPNFVDVEHSAPRYEPGRRIVYVGRLSREKGLATLVRAAAAARVGVTLVGTGPDAERLRALATELAADVDFPGFLAGAALHFAISEARAVVLPSECYENAPLSVLEAYALGKPVIGSSLGGIPELVRDGETGHVFTAGSVEHLSTILRATADARDETIAAMGRAGRRLVERDYSTQRYLERIDRVYASLGVRVAATG